MFKFIAVTVLVLWAISRGRLWKRLFNLRREIRSAVRRRSYAQYFVAIRWREIVGFAGFGLTAFSAARDATLTYGKFGSWVDALLYLLYAGTAFFGVYLLVDFIRLRGRFVRLINALATRAPQR